MTEGPVSDHTKNVEQEIGLRLPSGIEVFPPDSWHGAGVATVEERNAIVTAIKVSAGNLGMDEDELLARYSWVVREKTTHTFVEYAHVMSAELTDPTMLADINNDADQQTAEVIDLDPPTPD